MGIISTFLFSDPSESDLLWVKLNVEKSIVKKWVIVEGTFSHRGAYKGTCLREVLKETRFLEFANKVEIIICNQNLFLSSNEQEKMFGLSWMRQAVRVFLRRVREFTMSVFILSSAGISRMKLHRKENVTKLEERKYHNAEKSLRDQAKEAICKTASPEDWIFVCDVDEVLDGETSDIKEFFRELSENAVRFPSIVRIKVRQRLWDYDNLNINANLSRVLIRAELLIENRLNVGQVRISRTFGWWPKLPFEGIHEYSSCLSREGIERKFQTYVHLADSSESLEKALSCNTALTYGREEPQFLVKLDVNIDHQPKFVKENIGYLRTNLVYKQYEENRSKIFCSRLEYSKRVTL